MAYTGEQKREYDRNWRERRRLDWIAFQGGICAKCGSVTMLEVDHIDRATKAMEPAAIWSRSKEVREAELTKCQVLCSSCHKVKTQIEFKLVRPHGTYGKYNKEKCRCPLCKQASRDKRREQRATS